METSLYPDCAALPSSEPGLRYAYVRRVFLAEPGTAGVLRVAADQHALVWLNGHFLGRTFVHCHDDERRYAEWELAPHLLAGENVLALLLHAHGPAKEVIPGVIPPSNIRVTLVGRVGEVDLGNYADWKFLPAAEYQSAPRHNSLIGHSEHRDLRLEPLHWCERGFDDSAWFSPQVRPDSRKFLSAPLRPLAEDRVFPQRIVKQGQWREGSAYVSVPPSKQHRFWRVRFMLTGPLQVTVFFCHDLNIDTTLDGVSIHYPMDPPCDWVRPYLPVALDLPAGSHCLSGSLISGRPLELGWSVLPSGGDVVEWAAQPDGPFESSGANQPQRDRRLVTDRIEPEEDRGQLGEDGCLDLEVCDEDYSLVLEFDRTFTMLPVLEIAEATNGTRIEIGYSETVSQFPGLTVAMAYHDEVTLREGPQTYGVSFQYKSARVLVLNIRARGGRVRLRRVSAIYRRYDYARTGEFECSDARLTKVWEICRHTMEAGSQDFIMDGPWREQLLYIGDNYVHNQVAYYLFGNHEIVEWQHQLYALGQMPDGIFQPNQPCRSQPESYRLLDQVLLWPIQLEHHYLYTNGQEFVRSLLSNVRRHIEGFQKSYGGKSNGDPRLRDLPGWNWIDHPGLIQGSVRPMRHDGIPTGMNLLYLLAIQSAIRLHEWNGDAVTAASFRQLATELELRLRAEHFDAQRGFYADVVVDGKPSEEASLHLNLLAIEAGICDRPDEVLNRTWKREGVLQILGPFFRVHLFEVLHQLGRVSEMLAEMREVWGGYIDAGLTATPENMPVNGYWLESLGHPWGASPSIYLAKSIAGLAPKEPGWKSVEFAPHLEDLESLQVVVPTPFGEIRANLQQHHGKLSGTLEIPAGVSCESAVNYPSVELRIRS